MDNKWLKTAHTRRKRRLSPVLDIVKPIKTDKENGFA
jgi:hypothetical protein